MLNRRGSILITAYVVLFVLLILGGAFFNRSMSDKRFFDIDRERIESFYLAEAAVDTGLKALKNTFTWTSTGISEWTSPLTSLGRGEFEAVVGPHALSARRTITVYGYIPSKVAQRAEQRIEAIARRTPTENLDDGYALYTAANLEFSGKHLSYDVDGKVVYAGSASGDLSDICCVDEDDYDGDGDTTEVICSTPGGSEPAVTNEPSISPLATFDFVALRELAAAQSNPNTSTGNNIYTGSDLQNPDFPDTFYYQGDPANGPNVVYIEGDMSLSGNETVGGFFVVVGNVIQDPDVVVDSTLGGNVTVNGFIYTTGEFTLNGGGGSLNIDGSVWAGGDILVNGGGTVTYNPEYMLSIKDLIENHAVTVQLVNWRRLE